MNQTDMQILGLLIIYFGAGMAIGAVFTQMMPAGAIRSIIVVIAAIGLWVCG